MLELGWVSAVHWNSGTVDVQLTNDTAPTLRSGLLNEFRTEGTFVRTLAEAKETDEDVFLWVFIREEGFPTAVGSVVPSKKLDRLWADLVVNFVDLHTGVNGDSKLSGTDGMKNTYTDFTEPNVSAYCTKVFHTIKG